MGRLGFGSKAESVAVSATRTRTVPVFVPGVMVVPLTLESSAVGSVTVTGLPAGAVVAVTAAVLPVTPSRFGSAVFAGPVAGMMEAMAGKAGVGANVTAVTPTSITATEVKLSPGVAARAACTVNAVPADAR